MLRAVFVLALALLAALPLTAAPGRTIACVAHRGASAYAPENTVAAFRKAMEMGADYLECDVHLSSDEALVVMHDATLDRTTSGQGAVRDRTLAEIKALDAGGWFRDEFRGERVPTLAELFDLDDGRIGFVVEIKRDEPGIDERVVALIRARGLERRVIVISFKHGILQRMAPDIATGALYYAPPMPGPGTRWLGPSARLCTAESVREAHARQQRVNVWTVNDPDAMRRFADMGVDAITTDRPDVLKDVLSGL